MQDDHYRPPSDGLEDRPFDVLARPDSALLLRRILEIAEDAIISTDVSGRICLFNRGAERIFGYEAREAIGQPLTMLMPERFRGEHAGAVQQFAGSETTSRAMADRGQIWGVRKDGSEFPAEASISKVEIGGELIFTVILRDTTARREAEERMKSSLREKEVLLREVHHRVKNNLQVVSSLLNLQARGAPDEYVRRGFEESRNRVQSMALIHEQLYESRDLSNVNFPEYIQQLCSRLFRSYQVQKTRVKLRTEVGDVRLGVDLAVPCGLIVNELISNSLKYAFPAQRSGTIAVEIKHMQDESILLRVADDGVGLPPDVGFWNTKTLGLRLVRTLVRQIDGEIELGGPPGAEFRIRFSADGAREEA